MVGALQSFERVSKHPDIRMVSVDIFDTLLFRTTLPERVKFARFARAKTEAVRATTFGKGVDQKYLHLLRHYAARIVYRNRKLINGAREAKLDEIYDVMFSCMSVDLGIPFEEIEPLRDEFRRIELELEKGDLSVNKKLKSILQQASQEGKRIVAISDMYLSYEDIKELLEVNGVWDVFDEVYVSSEYGFGKASGYLFDEVLSAHDLLPCQVTHIGDNWFSDYHVPKDKGVFAFYYPRSFGWRAVRRLRTDVSYRLNGVLE